MLTFVPNFNCNSPPPPPPIKYSQKPVGCGDIYYFQILSCLFILLKSSLIKFRIQLAFVFKRRADSGIASVTRMGHRTYLDDARVAKPFIEWKWMTTVVRMFRKIDPTYQYLTFSSCLFKRLHYLILYMLGNLAWLLSSAELFRNQPFFKISFHEYVLIDKHLRSRSSPTVCRAWSGSKLVAKVVHRRHSQVNS